MVIGEDEEEAVSNLIGLMNLVIKFIEISTMLSIICFYWWCLISSSLFS